MADLTTTITESVIINGSNRGSTNTLTITGIEHTFERVVTVPSGADTTVLVNKNTVAGADGAVDIQDTKYIRITNLDTTNNVNLSLQIDSGNDDSAADESATISLPAGHSFIMGTPHDAVAVSDANATIVTAMHDLESIIVDSATEDVKVEVFVAGA
ncbi:MAG: hypothetical protein Unbinned4585contig1001_24 [Prokaryotic dsDNA virus sp.]|nr:MAG: hypothetical protein Unbinned4585contig1001_24 [Prokaryotic dsDNA virus sp.]|tara:strand:- start:1468 stop:1938 length:471 start_codon:yes stop_codon:yes gene_type:complete